MELGYRNKKLEKICTDAFEAQKEYGIENARKIHTRIKEIKASPNATFMVDNGIGRCHPLKGDKKGQYAVDLVHPLRLIFTEKVGAIIIARIENIEDYH